MSEAVYSTQEEVEHPENKHFHVVILGAGASLAAFPNGDRNGAQLPLIKNFVDVVGLAGLLQANNINPPDVEAVDLLKSGWGNAEERMLEETEIIDIRSEDELTQVWKPFIHSHHYSIHKSLYDSSIARHPRRSCEAIWQRVAMAQFVEGDGFPQNMDFNQLRNWLRPRLAHE